jgi:hypothetical protein
MGFWSGLGHVLGDIANPVGAIGDIAGAFAGHSAAGRQAEDQQNISRDRNALDLYNNQMRDVQQVPQSLTSQAVRADIIKNLQNRQITGLPSYIHVPQMTGGLQPSLLGNTARETAADMGRQAQNRLQQFASQNVPQTPQLSRVSKPGLFEKVMGGVGVGGSMLGAVPQKKKENK